MRNLLNQALGRSPEPLWMSIFEDALFNSSVFYMPNFKDMQEPVDLITRFIVAGCGIISNDSSNNQKLDIFNIHGWEPLP